MAPKPTGYTEHGHELLAVVDVVEHPAQVWQVEDEPVRSPGRQRRPRVIGEEPQRGARGVPERELEVRDERAR